MNKWAHTDSISLLFSCNKLSLSLHLRVCVKCSEALKLQQSPPDLKEKRKP